MYNAQTIVENIKKRAKQQNILLKDLLANCELSINTLNQITDKKGISSFSLAKSPISLTVPLTICWAERIIPR